MADVKVHYNSDKPAQMSALAFAQSPDIHLAPGREEHLPHEAWHVVQQKQGRVRETTQSKGRAINDNPGLEREADVMGRIASASTSVSARIDESSRPSSPSSGRRPVIQGKFGIEIELPILLTQRTRLPDGKLLHREPSTAHVARGDGFNVNLDHNDKLKFPELAWHPEEDGLYAPEGPIIELASDAWDDKNIDEDAIKGTVFEMKSFVADIFTRSAELKRRVPLTWLGLKTLHAKEIFASHALVAGRQSLKGSFQLTHGVPVNRIAWLLSSFSPPHARVPQTSPPTNDGDEHSPDQPGGQRRIGELEPDRGPPPPPPHYEAPRPVKTDHIYGAMSIANAIVEELIKEGSDMTRSMDTQRKGFEELHGILTLICYYVLAAREYSPPPDSQSTGPTAVALLKNNVGRFYYKGRLSDLVRQLFENKSPAITYLVEPYRFRLINTITRLSGVRPEDTMFDLELTYEHWLHNVLTGSEDAILDESINGYSKRLDPEPVGPSDSLGFVIEDRRPREYMDKFEFDGTMNSWDSFILKVISIIRRIHDGPGTD